jgi:hypothetical protein
MEKGVLTMASPNNPISRNGFDKNILTTQGKAPTLPPNQTDIASFKAQLSIANDKVVIGNSSAKNSAWEQGIFIHNETKGRKNGVEPEIDLNYGGYNKK